MSSRKKFLTSPKFKLACLGGTFDHFHFGHKAFLEKAFAVSQKVIIGLTSDRFTKSKVLPQVVFPFEKRKKELKRFLKKKGFLERAEIVKIEGAFTSQILDPLLECLLVTKKTQRKASLLNRKRREKGLDPLKIVVAPLVVDRQGRYLSSTKIRLGEIDRRGNPWIEKKFFEKKVFLPQRLKVSLKKPLGKVFLGSEKNFKEAVLKLKRKLKEGSFPLVGVVGDQACLSLLKEEIYPSLLIVDFKIGRKKVPFKLGQFGFSQKEEVREVENQAGTLTPALFKVIKEEVRKFLLWQKPRMIKVLGEEDLAVLPLVLASPLDSLVLYGQPQKGIVALKVSEEKKKEVRKIISQFQEKEKE